MYDTLKALLKKNGYSLTSTRKTVFDLLYNQEPQSIQELIERATNKADRATVYRAIELFERLGVAHRVNTGWKYKVELSDLFLGHHHHFHCNNCNKTYTLAPNAMLETMIDSTVAKSGFAPRTHQLEVYGICAKCAQS